MDRGLNASKLLNDFFLTQFFFRTKSRAKASIKVYYIHRCISVVEEVVQYIEDGGLGEDELLQVLRVEVVSVHVDGAEEDGLHLVVTQLVGRLVRGYQHLCT